MQRDVSIQISKYYCQLLVCHDGELQHRVVICLLTSKTMLVIHLYTLVQLDLPILPII